MQSQFAYALVSEDFEESRMPESSFLDEVRLSGGVGAGTATSSTSTGIKGLMLAVLEDGIRSFLCTDPVEREEAEYWMTMRAQSWPFSFVTVCQSLDLEPGAVHRALCALRDRVSMERRRVRRSRPNVRRKGEIRLEQPRRRS